MKSDSSELPKTAKLSKRPIRKRNQELRSREYLTSSEVSSIRKAARSIGRHGHRDDTLILLMFRHGLRVSEAINLKWEQVDLNEGVLHVIRLKSGKPSTHPIYSSEIRALRKLQRDYPNARYLFISERGAPLSDRTAHHVITRAGKLANIGLPIHPHMLRHSTGYYLANKGTDTRTIQAYLGHANIKNTVIYTEISPNRFNALWDD